MRLPGKFVHLLFTLGVILKAIDGVAETIGGIVLFCVGGSTIRHFIYRLTLGELTEDPHDPVANYLSSAAAHLSVNSQVFAAAYLLGHGAIKIFLVTALLRGQAWAFLVAEFVLLAFMGYQAFRFFHTFSMTLAALTLIDALVVLFVWLEYRRRFAGRADASPGSASMVHSR